jgi:hypothetical protein
MKEQNNTIYYKKKIIPETVFIDTNDYFTCKTMSDLLDPRCQRIKLSDLSLMKQKNNFEFDIEIPLEDINSDNFHIEKLLKNPVMQKDFQSDVRIKIIVYPNTRDSDTIFTISNKIIFSETDRFFYNILNYDENGELFYTSSLNNNGEPEFKESILPTNIYFYQSKMDNYHWRYLEPDDETLTQFFMENQINPLLNEKKDIDLTLMNFNFN